MDVVNVCNKMKESGYENMFIERDNEILFRAIDICSLLLIKNISMATKRFNSDEKKIFKCQTKGGLQNVLYLTFNGLKRLLSCTRSVKVREVANQLGLDIKACIFPCIESQTINCIITAFKNEKMCLQFSVDVYRIDLYFPYYKLAIECDEMNHNESSYRENDISRELNIKNKLQCTFIRFKPYCKDFNIFEVINKIHQHIRNTINNRCNDIEKCII